MEITRLSRGKVYALYVIDNMCYPAEKKYPEKAIDIIVAGSLEKTYVERFLLAVYPKRLSGVQRFCYSSYMVKSGENTKKLGTGISQFKS